jgi:hypothetical protein
MEVLAELITEVVVPVVLVVHPLEETTEITLVDKVVVEVEREMQLQVLNFPLEEKAGKETGQEEEAGLAGAVEVKDIQAVVAALVMAEEMENQAFQAKEKVVAV